jgi:glycosyltransferase involved in cell wall biosynthesis
VVLAFFTPWPPDRSGVAGRSRDVVTGLAARGHAVDVFVDEQRVPALRPCSAEPPAPGEWRLQSAHEFVWRAARGQYDLTIYQAGNSTTHAFVFPYARQFPGLLVLHDARLHHARGHALLSRREPALYRAIFQADEPGVPPDAAELAVAGFDGIYYYLWPLLDDLVGRSRMTAVHARGAVDALIAAHPDCRIVYLALGDGRPALPSPEARAITRSRLGAGAGDIVFGVFGGLTPDKRIGVILRAFARARLRAPDARLWLAGEALPDHDWRAMAGDLGVLDRVTFAPGLDDAAFAQAVAAADVTIHLRWPSALETSGPWLLALAAGRPTVISELPHLTHIPAVDPRSWTPYGDPAVAPVAVAVDVLDEEHSLALAMRRLAADPALRRQIGDAGRRHWEAEHTVSRMVDDYERLLPLAIAAPVPARPAAGATLSDPARRVRALLEPFPEVSCELR